MCGALAAAARGAAENKSSANQMQLLECVRPARVCGGCARPQQSRAASTCKALISPPRPLASCC